MTVVVACCAAAIFACGAATTGESSGKGSGKAGSAPLSSDSKVATIGDWSISLADLDTAAEAQLSKARETVSERLAKVRQEGLQQEYDIRQQVLDGLMEEQLFEREARAREVTRDELLQTEVASKVTEPTQAEIDAFFNGIRGRLRPDQTKELLEPQIRATLRSQQSTGLHREFISSLRKKYGAKVMIEPPRVTVSADDDASRGPIDAPITIVEFSDFQCPYCARGEESITQVLQKYGDKVRVVYRDYPLSFHQNAEIAAIGAECAEEQGKFWEMHGAMFANQQKLAAADLVETAAGIGLNKDEFKACLDSGKYLAEVQNDFKEGASYGVTGTPAFFINGVMVSGAQPPEAFYEIIDRELERLEN
jgi:protein-disulfide isomerase